ncbi:MAG: cation diffusion facilitator family transporter [Gemmatimonadaceae bacterium]
MPSHNHSHGHSHGHSQSEPPNRDSLRRLWWALAITLGILVAELLGGLLANSLALLADAGHVLTDAAALGLSLFVIWFSARPSTPTKTFGYLRWEILAAFLNGATLLLISVAIIWEAFARLRAPQPVESGQMLLFAGAGAIANVFAAWILHPASDSSLNIRGAYLHVLGDLLGSAGTVVAALIVRFTGWVGADPIASVVVTLLVVRSAWNLVRESIDVLLEATPAHISLDAVRAQLEAIPGIESVHDLHVWTVTSRVIAMSAHAVVRAPERHQHVLEHIHDAMRLFGIEHITVQLEREELHEPLHA